jgi:hypothetical protein
MKRLFRRLPDLLRTREGMPACGIVLLALGVGLCFVDTPIWWFGGALLASGLTVLRRAFSGELHASLERLRRPRRWLGLEFIPLGVLTDVLYAGVVIVMGTTMMWDVAGGERPVSHDHTIHYFKAWLLHTHLLPHGNLFGWSHAWFAGYPANYLYPPGADLWVNAVHAMCLGALSFSRAYALAFLLFHVGTGLVVYRLGRLVGGPHVGVIAAILALTDLADFRMGGWDYTVEYGVWPQTLSLNFALMALCSLPGIVEGRRLRSIGAFGIWMGFAIITHPIQLIFMALAFVAAGLAAGFAQRVVAATAVIRLFAAYVLSLFVGSIWLIPFMTSRGETNQMGVWWDSTYEMGKGILDLRAMPGTLGYVMAFGILALVVMLRSRRFLLLFMALMALVIPAVSNSTFIDEFHLPALSTAFIKVQFIRLSTMVKPFWFVLAAYFVVTVLARARSLVLGLESSPRTEDNASRAAALAAVVGLLVVPVGVPTWQAFATRHVFKSMTTESVRPLAEDRRRLENWLRHSLPKDGFYRVGVFTGHNHDLMDLGTQINRPIYKRGFTPASNFIYQMNERDSAILTAINLRFAITKIPLPQDDFDLVAEFGQYRVYRYRLWQPRPFEIVQGAGKVRVLRFEDETIELQADAGATGKLRLNVSYFSRWHAYRDGQPLAITLTYLREAKDVTGFMTVPLAPGRYRFVFERTLGDRLAIPLGLLALVFCLGLCFVDERPALMAWCASGFSTLGKWLDRASEPRFGRIRLVLLCVCAASVLGVGILLALWRPAIATEELGPSAIRRVRYDFLENLSRASANIEYHEINQPCLRQGDHLVCRDAEGHLDNERYIASSPATIKEYTMVRCIRARPEQGGLLSISYPRVGIGDAIVGYFGIERAGRLMFRRRPVEFRVMVDGKIVYQGETQSDNKMHYFKAPLAGEPQLRSTVTFSVRADNVNKRYFCFNAQMVDLK